jgi:CitMHS family citrate-Mg2+:H+ or citrate-Ca2+:H+ symporter
MDVMELWVPFIPTQAFGLFAVLALAIYWGRKDKSRLIKEGLLQDSGHFNAADYIAALTPEQEKLRRPKMLLFNWLLIIVVLGLMCANKLSPLIAFMFGVVLALIINYRDATLQRQMVDEKGKDALLLSTVIFAAGIMMGILGGTGMSKAMTQALVDVIPVALSPFIAPIVGFFSVPLHLLFDPDSYYFGVMPIIADMAKTFGIPAVDVARASIIGQTTVGWTVSPMVGTFFLFVGMCKLDIGEWQKWAIKYYMGITAVMTIFAMLTGVFTL